MEGILNAKLTKVPVKENDILFFCLNDASIEEINEFRDMFEETCPGIKAMFCNFDVKVHRAKASGVTSLTISCESGMSTKNIEDIMRIVGHDVHEINDKKIIKGKSRYSLIKED